MPSWTFAAVIWAMCVTAVLLVGLAVISGIREDEVRHERCANLGGYIAERSLCRDRSNDAVIATWDELGF